MPIRMRIVLPLAGLFLVSYGALSVLAIWMVARAAEERTIDQLETMASFVSSWEGISVNPRLVDYIRGASGAEIVIAAGSRAVPELSTAGTEIQKGVGELIRRTGGGFGRGSPGTVAAPGGDAFVAVRADLDEGMAMYLLFPERILQAKKWEAAGPLALMSAVGLLAVIVVGFLIARGIARPIEDLARHAREVVDLETGGPLRVSAGSIEIRNLEESLNRMLSTLRKAQQRAMEAERAQLIRVMAGSIAHEVKNPLQALQMILQTARGLPEEDRRILLNELRRVELASLELLTLAGPARLRQEPLGLAETAEATLDLLRRSLDHLGVKAEREFSEVRVAGDPDRLQRAMMNLILNGAQAMPEGGVLTVRVARGSNGFARFAVTDRGPGIPGAVQERLFEPFFTTKQDGVGLGLFVTKSIIEQHGGRVGVESDGTGTTVYFEIPAEETS